MSAGYAESEGGGFESTTREPQNYPQAGTSRKQQKSVEGTLGQLISYLDKGALSAGNMCRADLERLDRLHALVDRLAGIEQNAANAKAATAPKGLFTASEKDDAANNSTPLLEFKNAMDKAIKRPDNSQFKDGDESDLTNTIKGAEQQLVRYVLASLSRSAAHMTVRETADQLAKLTKSLDTEESENHKKVPNDASSPRDSFANVEVLKEVYSALSPDSENERALIGEAIKILGGEVPDDTQQLTVLMPTQSSWSQKYQNRSLSQAPAPAQGTGSQTFSTQTAVAYAGATLPKQRAARTSSYKAQKGGSKKKPDDNDNDGRSANMPDDRGTPGGGGGNSGRPSNEGGGNSGRPSNEGEGSSGRPSNEGEGSSGRPSNEGEGSSGRPSTSSGSGGENNTKKQILNNAKILAQQLKGVLSSLNPQSSSYRELELIINRLEGRMPAEPGGGLSSQATLPDLLERKDGLLHDEQHYLDRANQAYKALFLSAKDWERKHVEGYYDDIDSGAVPDFVFASFGDRKTPQSMIPMEKIEGLGTINNSLGHEVSPIRGGDGGEPENENMELFMRYIPPQEPGQDPSPEYGFYISAPPSTSPEAIQQAIRSVIPQPNQDSDQYQDSDQFGHLKFDAVTPKYMDPRSEPPKSDPPSNNGSSTGARGTRNGQRRTRRYYKDRIQEFFNKVKTDPTLTLQQKDHLLSGSHSPTPASLQKLYTNLQAFRSRTGTSQSSSDRASNTQSSTSTSTSTSTPTSFNQVDNNNPSIGSTLPPIRQAVKKLTAPKSQVPGLKDDREEENAHEGEVSLSNRQGWSPA
jgi:hypothetical protein